MEQAVEEGAARGGSISGIRRIFDGPADCYKYAREELRHGADFPKFWVAAV